MPIISALFQFERMCCQNEHLPSFLYSLWQASHVFHLGLHLHSQWLMTLSIMYHLYPFSGALFIQIISPLLVDYPFIVKLWMFFVEWRYGKLCIVPFRPRGLVHSLLLAETLKTTKSISLSEKGPYKFKEGNVPKQGCVKAAQLCSECDIRRQQTLGAL